MDLPKVIGDLIRAQNNFDSETYASCFSQTGVMIEEGQAYTGRIQIRKLIEETNKKYRSVMKPVDYIENGSSSVLSAECSGAFPGSPAVLKFNFDIVDGQIQYLKVTG